LKVRWTPGRYISIINRKCQLYLDRNLSRYGLGKGLYLLLLELKREEGINQKKLADRVVLDQASVTRAVKKLLDLGFVKRAADSSDGRARNIFLTEKGSKILETVQLSLNEWDAMAIRGFSEADMEKLAKLLEKMADNL
jgi:DNA-binding MarR family transcriptional regulator